MIVSLGLMAMPIHWTISHPTRLVLAVCKESVSRPDVEAYLDNVVVDGALGYAKIFELKDCTWMLDENDMMALGARIQAYAKVGTEPMGPLAIVAASPEHEDQARIFGALATAKRPLKIFRELHAARRWLEQQDTAP
jgi:hypothetical protein